MHWASNEGKFDSVPKSHGPVNFVECDKKRSKMHNFHQSDRIGLKLGRYS